RKDRSRRPGKPHHLPDQRVNPLHLSLDYFGQLRVAIFLEQQIQKGFYSDERVLYFVTGTGRKGANVCEAIQTPEMLLGFLPRCQVVKRNHHVDYTPASNRCGAGGNWRAIFARQRYFAGGNSLSVSQAIPDEFSNRWRKNRFSGFQPQRATGGRSAEDKSRIA